MDIASVKFEDAIKAVNERGVDFAFPFFASDAERYVLCAGMTLRDYFAAKAMHGMLSSDYDYEANSQVLAGAAYRIADAMLKERQS